jgi:hypothetical protein
MYKKLSNKQISFIKDFYIQKYENDNVKNISFLKNQKLKIFLKTKFDNVNKYRENNLLKSDIENNILKSDIENN